MIDPKFPTRSELMKMTIREMQGLRILYQEEEMLVQSVVDAKNDANPVKPVVKVFDNDIKGAKVDTPEQEAKLQAELDKRRAEAKKAMGITEEEIVKANENVIHEPAKKRFCEFCDSKGVRHKKICPTLNENTTTN